jgi:hypothetical protein
MATATTQQATTQQAPTRGVRRRHSRHRRFLSRIRPATWRKIGAYLLVYAIAVVVCWRL